MNIVVKNADFSAVSIGKYASQEVRELLSAYSSITENQIMAINTFLLSIGYGEDNSVWTKMKHLFLPCVSANLNEALYDLVNRAEPTFYTGNRDYVVFDGSQKSVTSTAAAKFVSSNYDAIKICPFAVSKTKKAANGIDSEGSGFIGVDGLGSYFGDLSQLSYSDITPKNILVLVTAGIDADSLNAADVRLVSETGVTIPFNGSSKIYSSRTLKVLLYAQAHNHDAEDIILGWAEGLSLDEGVLLETSLNKLQQDLL